jgi:ADP-ribose pyrophosphatase
MVTCRVRLGLRAAPAAPSSAERSGSWASGYRRPVTDGRTPGLTRWTIHGERVVDESRRARLSIAEVELPDGVRFEQYVLRAPRSAMMVVLDDENRVLLMWRHRFIIDRWVWELPGGYVDEAEDPAVTAAREVEEETGWRPRSVEPLVSFQPMVGTADAENLLFLSHGADHTGAPADVNEAERVGWVPLADALGLIERGEIVGSGTVIGLLSVLAMRQHGEVSPTDDH